MKVNGEEREKEDCFRCLVVVISMYALKESKVKVIKMQRQSLRGNVCRSQWYGIVQIFGCCGNEVF